MKHTIFGISTVSSTWRDTYNNCKIGDPISKVINAVGQADEVLNLGDIILYTYESKEWKGWARGGTITRKMQFTVRNGQIIAKNQQNIDALSF